MLLTATAEGGAQGATVAASEVGSGSPWDSVVGTPQITYDNAHARGVRAYKVDLSAVGTAQQLVWSTALGGTITEMWGRVYLWSSAAPAGARIGLLRFMNGGSQAARLIYETNGTLQLADAGNAAELNTVAAVATGQWTRIEWHITFNATSAPIEVRLFNDANSETATEVVSGTAVGMGAGCTAVQIGAYLNGPTSSWTGWLDDIEVNDTGFPGPIAIPSGGGTLTATVALSGTGTKVGIGGGTLTATATLSGTGEDITPAPPTFPYAALDVRSELYIPGHGWVDTIDRALVRDPVTITRGRADETARPTPSKASLSLRDQAGKWANRNPRSPYFGLLGRNTPIRIRIGDAPPYAYMPGVTGNYISTPDDPTIELNGYIDIRMEITPDTWRPNLLTVLASKMDWHGEQDSWTVMLRTDGRLRFRWTETGASSASRSSNSPNAVPADSGRLAVRVVFNGADSAHGGVRTYSFYTAPSLAGPWAPLGDTDIGPAPGVIFSGSAPLEIGTAAAGTAGFGDARIFHGHMYGFELRDGAGTLIAGPGITDQTEGTTEWTGPDGLPWTAHGSARLLRPARFHGEVASWPPSWHVSGGDVRVQLQAAGVRRRLSQGAAPVQSALRRSIPASVGVVAYWPMEDTGGSFASALGNSPALRPNRNAGAIEYQADTEFVGSAALPRTKTGQAIGSVPSYTPQANESEAGAGILGGQTVMLLLHMPDTALGGARRIVALHTTGTGAQWDLWYSPGSGVLAGTVYNREGGKVEEFTTPLVAQGRLLRVAFRLTQFSTNSVWAVSVLPQGGDVTDMESYSFGISATMGVIRSVTVGDASDLGDTVIGHVTVYDHQAFPDELSDEFAGYAGETAAERLTRLADENSVRMQIVGQLDDTAAMGPQRVATLLELMDEAADADGGVLHDSRGELGFEYRSRASLYNQARRVVLDYTAPGEVPPELQPVEDDQAVRNDVTVTRDGGSSTRVVREDGPLSVLAPPDGVGTYDEAVTFNLAGDDQTGDAAGWRVHLGTWDEARYPKVTMWAHTAGRSNPAHVADIASMDVGDRFAITNPPPWLPPADIDQLAQGYKEVLKPHSWEVEVNATPAGPWDVAVVDEARADTSGSVLAAVMDATATGLVARPTAGPFWDVARPELFWTTDPADLPFTLTVGGEEMTVTAVGDAGAEVADTFSVTAASGWGTADTGQPWAVAAGAAADFSAATGTGGVITSGTVGVERGIVVDAGTPHQHVLFHSNTNVIPTGAPITWGAYLRWAGPGSYYWVGVEIGTDSSLTLRIRKRVAGVLTLLASAPSATAHAFSPWRILRCEAVGSQLRAKVWPAGDLEPDWEIEAVDADLTAGDSLGCVVRRETGSTNGTTTAFDLFAATPQAQTLTVVRSANGISKSHSVGEDIRLAHSAYIAR